MKYMFVLLEHEEEIANRDDPAKAESYWSGWRAYFDIVAKADPNFSGAALQPASTATTVRASGIEDGPFADTREQLGGFFLADLDNLDEALQLAQACPATKRGAVEVRPVQPTEDKGE